MKFTPVMAGLLAATCLGLMGSPASAQTADGAGRSDKMPQKEYGDRDERGGFDRDREREPIARDDEGRDRERVGRDDRRDQDEDEDEPRPMQRLGGGSSFLLQMGTSRMEVRCGEEPAKACVDAAMALMDKAKGMQSSSVAPPAAPEKPKQ